MKNLLLIGLILLSSCSANWHVRQARKHLEKAKEKDSTVVISDTTEIPRDTVIVTPGIEVDTAVYAEEPTDTTTVTVPVDNSTDSVTVTTFYNKDTKKQHIKVKVPERKDTVTVTDKIVNTTAIEQKRTPLRSILYGAIVVLIIIAIIGSIIRRLLSK